MAVQNIDFNNVGTATFNGISLSKVIYNAALLWENFKALWSGNSFWYFQGYLTGIGVSGNLFRFATTNQQTQQYGPWITSNSNGTFTGDSKASVVSYSTIHGLETSGNLVRMIYDTNGAWVTFNKESGFTGTSRALIAGMYGNTGT